MVNQYKIYPRYAGRKAPTQSGEHIDLFPIITGLRKTEKILTQPFDAYFHHFYQSIFQNSKLLIIGYGFGDLYLNSILEQFTSIHGENGKAIVITYLNKADWVPWIYDNPSISHNMKQFLYHLYQETDFSDRLIAWEQPDFIDSKNQTKSIYTLGFQNTAKNYVQRILDTFA